MPLHAKSSIAPDAPGHSRQPVAALGNQAVGSVIEQFGPLVRRAGRARFSRDGIKSSGLHEQFIKLLATGDAEDAATVTYDIWHSLPADDDGARN